MTMEIRALLIWMKLHYVQLSAETNLIMLNACPISAKIDGQSLVLAKFSRDQRMKMEAVQIVGISETS